MEGLISPQSRKIKGEGTPDIPEEVVIEEILPRLPVKSLLKFRCVAKSWCSLIASKKFMKAHLQNSIKTSRFAHHPISFYTTSTTAKDQVCLPSLFDMPFTDRETFNADSGIDCGFYMPIELVGCCNGLVCLLIDDKRFILWNPATKKFNNLPDFYNNKIEYTYNIKLHGFGFDELCDDYKVFVRVWDVKDRHTYSIVYSLRSNSWNVIEETGDYVYARDRAGMYVNGKLHWYKRAGFLYSAGEIVSFDLNSYVRGPVVQLPIVTERVLIRLGVVGGCLSAHYYSINPNMGLDVWILKESWHKVATVRHYSRPKSRLFPTPIAIHPNGDIFLIYGSDIVIYDTKSDEFRHPNITSYDVFRDMCIFIESLAPVAPDA